MICSRAEPDSTSIAAPSHSLHLPLEVFDFDSKAINGELRKRYTQDGTNISPAPLLDVSPRSGRFSVATEAEREANVKEVPRDMVNARVTDKDKDASVTLWCSPRLDPGLFIGENQFCGDVGSLSSLVSGLRSGSPMSGGFPVDDVIPSRISDVAGAAVKEDLQKEGLLPLDTRGSDLFILSESGEGDKRQPPLVEKIIPIFSGNGDRKVAEKSIGRLRDVLAKKQPNGVEGGGVANNESFNVDPDQSDASITAVHTMEDNCYNGDPCITLTTDTRNAQAARSSDASLVPQGDETGRNFSLAPFHGDLISVPTVETNQ